MFGRFFFTMILPTYYWTLMITLLMGSMSFVDSIVRGPHHPRGETIIRKHTHHKPDKSNAKLMEDEKLVLDKEHIQEHLEKTAAKKIDVSQMTEAELELYYFLLHDSDKNNKLDGLELLNAILHTIHNDNNSENRIENDVFDKFVDLVDQVLRDEDKNQNGYLDYSEYVDSRRRAQTAPNPAVIFQH